MKLLSTAWAGAGDGFQVVVSAGFTTIVPWSPDTSFVPMPAWHGERLLMTERQSYGVGVDAQSKFVQVCVLYAGKPEREEYKDFRARRPVVGDRVSAN